ncbi:MULTISPECIES: transcriptional regulator [Pectobacterium]|uniref:Uncharacterized protein n=1 Tax=Pectobacterium carotovorum subsp. carotovorum TaxID=555 RepID=A0AAI9L339_PECCC|nr:MULTISPECIES: transcriptional regulator [Pectobacterium]TKY80309.1 transcriptional regulator [Pectobacterium polonicum]UFT92857.1 transcriptional regulator [Pectobacterium carotovorum]GKX39540.1 hypothetical protein SOASR014_32790 [Pectobacterium carotovorum subsp. carotovorum]GKX48010.1 hypothetical protein SOASR016_27620 [Pectobacterium carotovorum subsp. carotovorum]GLV70454.1 hypothetical protein Pcaca03_28980 [Pectobacterium carotovorum subsp. carotovorum]
MSNDLFRWRKQASADEWKRLASMAGTTVGYLNQIAYGFRRPSARKAEIIEVATRNFGAYQPVTKENLVFTIPRGKTA